MPKIISGRVKSGVGVARKLEPELMALIRQRTAFPNLQAGTLNVHLGKPHYIQDHHKVKKAENIWWPKREAMWFERCQLRRNNKSIRALIMRTSTNFHGFSMLEIMAECELRDFFSLKDGDEVQVEVFDSFDEAKTATQSMRGRHQPRAHGR
jgi:CTP-dependent riboflavin kinase